ncbi:hypothetical protein HS088_TW21G00766 [Tripterygium wilfordii]|uniref:Uncharacterized protein n=1 Tax=Tripterygium wilfordii TaxID=458696 RepID=A0A7J7C3D4_TRIWF|nr:hypothetical protein HS088_TW21G00766 [Tripterygium wilfordii]
MRRFRQQMRPSKQAVYSLAYLFVDFGKGDACFDDDDGIGPPTITAIVIPTITFIALVALTCILLIRRRRKRSQEFEILIAQESCPP